MLGDSAPATRMAIRTGTVVAFLLGTCVVGDPAPTTLEDFFLPGSQPNQSGTFRGPSFCDNCHGDYDLAVEPVFNWRGSAMAQAARDPLYYATVAIANQDAPNSGDLCIRCHSPVGWLEGRSLPTDGSALTAGDREGVQCNFCHRMVKPTSLGVNPYPADPDYTSQTYPADQSYLGTINPIPGWSADGMYIADSQDTRRGPYVDPPANHQTYYSPFHRDAALCGTCHDVSNPVLSREMGADYSPNTFGEQAPNFDPQALMPVERTYSEWVMSAYNTPGGVYAPQFGGNNDYVSICQDCHLRDVTGKGCDRAPAPLRDDLPLHDMTGGNTFLAGIIDSMFPGEADPAALGAGVTRARYMLEHAATLSVHATTQGDSHLVVVRITNETGHKLPSGYPEGRRMWLNVRAYDQGGSLLYESGAYDSLTAVLQIDPHIAVYEVKPGISPALAALLNLSAGPSFHFVLNDTVYKDNRIPPRGFTNAHFDAIQSPPVGYAYADSEFWDDRSYPIPSGTDHVVVTLCYQTTSKEYVEFLRDENTTNHWGNTLYALWQSKGMSAPVPMTEVVYQMPGPIVLTGQEESGLLTLTWSPCANAAAYWVYGAPNDVYFLPGFDPGYEYRLTVLPSGAQEWSTSSGVGDPGGEWTYLIVGVDGNGLELCRSNRIGEREFLLP